MTLAVDLHERSLRPGGLVRGCVTLAPALGDEGSGVELSVLWETSGRGNTDRGVVFFRDLPTRGAYDFEARLPLLPLTYEGELLQIRWLVRVRRLRARADDELVDEPFRVEPPPP